MRLRPTAVGSTLRETARPRRGGAPSRSQCRLSSGALVRLAPSNTRAKSALARIRAARGKMFREGIGRRLRPARSGAEALAALGTTTGQDLAAVGGRHAGTETVVALALEVAGLVGALGGHGWILYRVTDGKDSESYGILGITVNGRVSSIGGGVGGAPAVRRVHPRPGTPARAAPWRGEWGPSSRPLGGGPGCHPTRAWNMVLFTMWHSGDFPPLLLTPRGRELVPPEACCNSRADQGSIGVECSAWSLRNAECSTPRLKRCRPRLGLPSEWYPAVSLSRVPCCLPMRAALSLVVRPILCPWMPGPVVSNASKPSSRRRTSIPG